jgi:site-specific recombinase XerC
MSRRRPTDAEVGAAFEAVAGRPGNLVDIGARAARTWLAYAATLATFTAWCAGRGIAMPAPAGSVREWLVQLASAGRSVATIRAYEAALSVAYALRAWPVERHVLAETRRSIRRRYSMEQRHAAPIRKSDLRELLAGMVPTRPADARDAAILGIGWGKLLRSSEITSLDWHRHGAGLGYVRIDDAGATITLLRSKTAQASAWRTFIARADMREAVEAVENWAAVAKLKPAGPLFVGPIHGHRIGARRLNPDAVCAMIRRRVLRWARSKGMGEAEAKELARAVSGHSLRAGGITAQYESGVDLRSIQKNSRHTSLDQLTAYIRAAEELHDPGLAKTWGS